MIADNPASSLALVHDVDQLRLLAKVARMYHDRGIRQPQIAAELHISQSRVSRLLRQAADLGIVQITVSLPSGVHTDLEESLRLRFGLLDAIVVETAGDTGDLVRALGAAAGTYLTETLTAGDVVGISSWSATLLAAVEAMRPRTVDGPRVVTQLVGGLGDPSVQVSATRLLDLFSRLTGARPVFLPAPGLVKDAAVRRAILRDPAVTGIVETWHEMTVAVVGIGSLQPSPLLERSGNALSAEQREQLQRAGAVGDVCLRFFTDDGDLVNSNLNAGVVGINPDRFKKVRRRIGVAGGPRKQSAVAAAVAGGWINILITDLTTAEWLLSST